MTQPPLLEPKQIKARQTAAFTVDEARCSSCGLCVKECPLALIQGNPPRVEEEQAARCNRCQHCMAICPTGAVSIEGRNPEDSPAPMKSGLPSLEQINQLVRGRRSTRQYQDKDVDPALVQQLLEALSFVPTAHNALDLTLTVIDHKASLAPIREAVLRAVEKCIKEGRIPDQLAFLKSAPAAFFEQGVDLIFRGAPHLLLVSAPQNSLGGQWDISIALTTFELMATTAGLGAVWCGMLKAALELAPEMKSLLDLPTEGVHYYPILFGYPAVKYARGVQREGAAVIKRLS